MSRVAFAGLRCPSGRGRAAAEPHPQIHSHAMAVRPPTRGSEWTGSHVAPEAATRGGSREQARWTAGIPGEARVQARQQPPAGSLPQDSGEAAGGAAMDRVPADRRCEASPLPRATPRWSGFSQSWVRSQSARRCGDCLDCVRLTRSPSSGPSLWLQCRLPVGSLARTSSFTVRGPLVHTAEDRRVKTIAAPRSPPFRPVDVQAELCVDSCFTVRVARL
jgi:hypothetical protein